MRPYNGEKDSPTKDNDNLWSNSDSNISEFDDNENKQEDQIPLNNSKSDDVDDADHYLDKNKGSIKKQSGNDDNLLGKRSKDSLDYKEDKDSSEIDKMVEQLKEDNE